MRKLFWTALGLAFISGCGQPETVSLVTNTNAKPYPAQGSTSWPWKNASHEELNKGVERWAVIDDTGTALELIRFDFQANPKLNFSLYDRDEDDDQPFDNRADYYSESAAHVTQRLAKKSLKPIAIWNGSFFGYDRKPGDPKVMAFHVGPVVLHGVTHYNVGLVRWTFGIKPGKGAPEFSVDQVRAENLSKNFEYAANGVECLVRNGKALPLTGLKTPTPSEAGSIIGVDEMRTSRTSVGWSADSRYLYALIIAEPDSETSSKLASRHGGQDTGGWTVADLQRFWMSLAAANAVNLDGGVVTQFVLSRNGKYEMVPPKLTVNSQRITLADDFSNAPQGGSIMYFAAVEKP